MPTYEIDAASGKTSLVEYEQSLWGTNSLKTTSHLTEAILPYAGLTGTLLLGMELTEGTSAAVGDILWFSASQIGLRVTSGTWTGGETVTGAAVSLTGGVLQPLLSRTAVTPVFQLLHEIIEANTGFTTADETVYLDVQNAKKIIITNLTAAGFLGLFNESTSYPLTGWIGPGRSVTVNVNHRVRKLVVHLSAAGLGYSIAVEGAVIPEISLMSRNLRVESVPQEAPARNLKQEEKSTPKGPPARVRKQEGRKRNQAKPQVPKRPVKDEKLIASFTPTRRKS